MKKKRAIKITVICLLALISVLLLNTFVIPPLARQFIDNGPRIISYREPTDRERSLAERINKAIMEMDKIQDCEVLVLLSEEPIFPAVSLELENNVKFADFTESDIEAVKTIIISISMDIEGVVIDGKNINMSIGMAN